MADTNNIDPSRAGAAQIFNFIGQEAEVLTRIQGKAVFAFETVEESNLFPVGNVYPAFANTPLLSKFYTALHQVSQYSLEANETIEADVQDQVYTTLLNNIIAGYDISESDKGLIRFAYLNPDAEVDPSIKAKLDAAKGQALQQFQEQGALPADWVPPKADGQLFSKAYDETVNIAISKYGKGAFTEAQILDLRDAIYHPERASDWAKTILQDPKFQNLIQAGLKQAGFTTPAGWKPDTTDYDNALTDQSEANFDKAVFILADQQGLTSDETQIIKNLYYDPSLADTLPKTERNQQLLNFYYSLLNDVSKEMPAGWPKVGDPAIRKAMIESNYRYENDAALSKATVDNHLSNSDVDLVKQAMQMYSEGKDPVSDGHISPALAAIAQKILDNSRLAMISKYNLDTSWQPSGAILPSPGVYDLATINKILGDYQVAAQKFLSALPDTPEKTALINVLKAISDAMCTLSEDIYRMEACEATGHKDVSRAQFETMQFKIDLQARRMEEQREAMANINQKDAKSDVLGSVMDIVTPFLMVIAIAATALAALTLGPVVGAALFAMLVPSLLDMCNNMAAKFGKGFMQQGAASQWSFGIVSKALTETAKACGVTDPHVLQGLDFAGKVVGAILVVAAAARGGAPPSALIMVGSQFFNSSNCVNDLALACGASENTAAIVGTAVGGAVALLSVAASAAANVSKIAAEQGAEAAAKASSRAAGKVTQVLNVTSQVTGIAAAGVNTYASYIQKEADYARAALKRLESRYEAGDAKLTDLIEALKQTLKNLEVLLQGLTTWLGTVGASQAAIWEKNATPA